MAVHLRGMTADRCARRILDGVAARRPEFVVGGIEVLAVHLVRVSRRLVAFLVRNHPFRIRERIRRALFRRRQGLTVKPRIPQSW